MGSKQSFEDVSSQAKLGTKEKLFETSLSLMP